MDFIIKLGGSAITVKDRFETPKLTTVKNIASLLKKVFDSGKTFIIIHGAGSFGHFQAKEYGVDAGYGDNPARVRHGFCKTRVSVCKLNQLITDKLVDAGLPAVSIPPFTSWNTKDGVVARDGCDVIKATLGAGFIPVLHGDAVIDSVKGTNILSGDTVIKVLCEKLGPRQVVFLSDVDGVYNRPPNRSEAKLIREVYVSNDRGISYSFDDPIPSNVAQRLTTQNTLSNPDQESRKWPGEHLHSNSHCENQTKTDDIKIPHTLNPDDSAKDVGSDLKYDAVRTATGSDCFVTIETSQQSHDVTGGIRLKLDTAIDIVEHSQGAIDVVICNVESAAFQNLMLQGSLKGAPATQIKIMKN